jgi:hypothetical protein
VVDIRQVAVDSHTARPSHDRHERLEKAEVESQPEHMTSGHWVQRQTGDNGHGEGVHGQRNGHRQKTHHPHGMGVSFPQRKQRLIRSMPMPW